MTLFAIGFALAVILAVILLGPWLKGYRTQLFASLTGLAGVILPLLSQVFEALQDMDWRQYVLAGDKKNLAVLGIMAFLTIMMVVLRFMTTGPVGTKQ